MLRWLSACLLLLVVITLAIWRPWSGLMDPQSDAWLQLPRLSAERAAATERKLQLQLDQRLAFLHAELGEPDASQRHFPFGANVQMDGTTGPVTVQDDAVARLTAAVRDRRLVLINESHHRPHSRLLTLALLPALYEAGFRYLAVEALAEADAEGLNARGYPETQSSGYVREPVFGELLRRALQLGYTVVPYEAVGARSPVERETRQFEQLKARTFDRDPAARVLVHAGYAHVYEDTGMLFDARPLALLLDDAGFAPYTVDQTLAHADPLGRVHPRYREWLGQCGRPPCLLTRNDGSPLDLPKRRTDAVVLGADPGPGERGDWLALGGLRIAVPYPIEELCGAQRPCLVEARLSHESAAAIPVDRCVLRQPGGTDCPVLWLHPDVEHTVSARDPDGTVRQRLPIRAAAP